MVITDREISIGVWILVALAWMLTQPSIRKSLLAVVTAVAGPKLLIPLLLFTAYVAVLVLALSLVGIWNSALLKDTLVWFVVAGLVLFGKFMRTTEERFFRRAVLATIAVPELIQFVVGTVSFPLPVEFVLQPFIVLLVLLSAVAALQEQHRQVKTIVDWAIGCLGVVILGGTAIQIVLSWDQLASQNLVLDFYLPIVLTIGCMPFIYALGIYARYELAFIWVDFATDDARARRRAKAALVMEFGPSIRDVREFAQKWGYSVARSASLAQAREFIREQRSTERAEPPEGDPAH
jgi:hypothetical protein